MESYECLGLALALRNLLGVSTIASEFAMEVKTRWRTNANILRNEQAGNARRNAILQPGILMQPNRKNMSARVHDHASRGHAFKIRMQRLEFFARIDTQGTVAFKCRIVLNLC